MYKRITHHIVEEHFDYPQSDSPELFNTSPRHQRLKSVHRTLRQQQLDSNDYDYQPVKVPLRKLVDLRPWCGPVDDQFDLGSCTANATVNAYEILINQQQPQDTVALSRLFVYYNSRKMNNTIMEDSGAFVRDAFKAVKTYGICTEALWPYDVKKFTVEPTPEAYQDGEQRKISRYERINSVANMLDALNNDHPVVFGLTIFEPFLDLNSANAIVVEPLSNKDEQNLDGHAMCMVGYNMEKQLFLAKNSYGVDWGDQGYCWITFDYMRKYGYDMWVFDLT